MHMLMARTDVLYNFEENSPDIGYTDTTNYSYQTRVGLTFQNFCTDSRRKLSRKREDRPEYTGMVP